MCLEIDSSRFGRHGDPVRCDDCPRQLFKLWFIWGKPRVKFPTFVRILVTTVATANLCVLPAHAELQARDIGNTGHTNAFYDTTLKVTWLDVSSGAMTWDNANAWASSLNVGGVTGWRLPTMTVAYPDRNLSYDGSTALGFNVSGGSSEMASLFFDTLGNRSMANTSGGLQVGSGLTNTGGFQHLQSHYYWLGTETTSAPDGAWYFGTGDGYQSAGTKSYGLYAMAVRTGDVAPVPEPETYAMLLVGLGLIGAVARRREARTLGFGSLGRSQQ